MTRSTLLDRLPAVTPAVMRALAIAAVVAQAGIAVTGSIVRVTGSGLGCPTWPECFPGSLVPTPHPEVEPLTQWIEFGNRLLTGVVVLVAGACLLAALGTRPRRRRLTALALVQPLGVVAQAVIGGGVVLLGLVWWSVSVHLLVSMVLVWLAMQLVAAASDGAGPPRRLVPGAVRGLAATSTALLAAVLVAGSFVTAAGPHAGDAQTPRLQVAVQSAAQVHADLLFCYLGLLVGLGFALRAVAAPGRVLRRYAVLVGVVVAQGLLGGIQYALGIPEILVSLHVLGAALVTVAAAALWATLTERPALPAPTPAPAPALADRGA
ncbi:COX15/CtaA family protein [Pseudonocardia cypriaca]|uniref:Cytochrome c oxidase assembly protein subunit 15 n=1 Tax=Pseudonocardia cypriaca TaxID=882449 RepID=A0A543GI25_9PSEU|nr:COX15/CtaA family protein [Pseudonocardia cypriaca]TQM45722.1 cytochrome c oxidase assembly protein subunit 15 [Pseudonocardia cypriaca]